MDMNVTYNCKEKMCLLRALDFAIYETALFLDAYPDNKEALSYYHELKTRYEKLFREYERNCGPLTIYTNESHSSWDWTKTPFPWELNAD